MDGNIQTSLIKGHIMKRGKMNRKKSRSTFTRGAQRVHSKNNSRVMRGGIRL